MNGVQIFTDPNHFMTKQEIFSSVDQVSRAKLLEIGEQINEGFKGLGVAITGSSCYELSLMDADARKAFLKGIYSKEGVGLSIGRLSIGSSDYSAELYSYAEVPNDMELKHFSIERDEKYIIPMIKEILEINPDIFLFASPWSPPGWMKTGGSMCGGYMLEEYIDCYAEYIVKFIKAYAEHGITIKAITPQNEANTDQYGRMPACIWHPVMEAKFIHILRDKFEKNNMDVKIWMYDHQFSDANRVLWQLNECKGLKDAIDGVAFHYYRGSIEETQKVLKAYPSLDLHFTEGGPRLKENYDCDWCKWGIMVAEALQHNYKSFTGWNLMLDETGGPNIGPYFCAGLATRNSVTGELSYSGQYKAFSHISPYITSKSRISPIMVTDITGEEIHCFPKHKREAVGVAIDNQDGKLIVIVINPNENSKMQTKLFRNGVWWYAELQPNSISTLIIPEN